ncbi:hypothetical protein Bca101_043668 [Brassica carinata]
MYGGRPNGGGGGGQEVVDRSSWISEIHILPSPRSSDLDPDLVSPLSLVLDLSRSRLRYNVVIKDVIWTAFGNLSVCVNGWKLSLVCDTDNGLRLVSEIESMSNRVRQDIRGAYREMRDIRSSYREMWDIRSSYRERRDIRMPGGPMSCNSDSHLGSWRGRGLTKPHSRMIDMHRNVVDLK